MKVDRLISIIMLLLERDKISATKLAEMFDVTTRTIYRDIDAIELAGIPIVTYPGIYGGISIMEQYKVEKKLFTTDDVSSLLTGLSHVPSEWSNSNMKSTLAKIKSFIPESEVKRIELKSNQIGIELNSWMGNRNLQQNLNYIKHAFDSSTIIQFNYCDRNNQHSKRSVEPYRINLKDGSWYLECYCLEKKDYRSFKLSRMSQIKNTTVLFSLRDFKPLSLNRTDIMRNKLIQTKLLLDASLRDRILDHCDESCILSEKNGLIHVNFPFVPDEMGYNLLLSLGDKCQILEPSSIRKEMTKRIYSLYQLYI